MFSIFGPFGNLTIPRTAGQESPEITQQEAKKREANRREIEERQIDSESPSESHPINA